MRQHLLATVFTVSATPALHATELLSEHVFSSRELSSIRAEEFRPLSGREDYMHKLDFSSLNQSVSNLGFKTLLDLTGYGSKLKEVILPTAASNVRVPSGTRIKFVGNARDLNLSKLQLGSAVVLDLTAVTGMDVEYGASSRNAIPEGVRQAMFPDNAKEISVPVSISSFTAKGATKVHLRGDTFKGVPHSLSSLSDLKEIDFQGVNLRNAAVNISHLTTVEKVHLNPRSPAESITLHGEKTVVIAESTGLSKIHFTSKDVTPAAITAARTHVSHVEVLSSAADHAAVLGQVLDLHKRGDTAADKASVVAAIRHMGVTNVKELKLKSSHLSDVLTQLAISDFTGFSALEKLEIVDAAGEYADATIGSSHITKAMLPSSIKEFYSKNSVIIKGAMASGALDKKFNAEHLDLSEATGLTSLSAGTFTPASAKHLHLPSGLALSNATTRTFTASLSALTHLYTYGASDIADLQAANIPASVTHLDVSGATATTALPALHAGLIHVTVSAAYLAANTNSDKFATFVNFVGSSPATKTLVVKGAAGGALTTQFIPNVGTVDLRGVTGATSFSHNLGRSSHSNLRHLYLPTSFDVSASTNALALGMIVGPFTPTTVYFSGTYSGGNTLDATSYANSTLDFSAVTGGGLFRVPTTTRGLVLSSGVGGVSSEGAASLNIFDLRSAANLESLSGLPISATCLRLNNNGSSVTPFALDLSAHVNLGELSLNASKLTHVHLPATKQMVKGGFGSNSVEGHLNLSGVTGLVSTSDHPNPIRGLAAFTNAATGIHVISLPRLMPSDAHVDLSGVRSTISIRNLHLVNRVTHHATAAHLVKHAHSHGIHDRSNQYLWNAYVEEMISTAATGGLAERSLDLSEIGFAGVLATAQAELDRFFTALNAMPAGSSAGQKGYVQNIHIRVPDAITTGTLYVGRTSATSYASGLKSDLRVSVHKHSGLTVEGSGFVNTTEAQTDLTTPAVTAAAGDWTAWINQQTLKGSTFLDLSSHQFASQAQLDAFFEGLRDAADRVNITRIDIGFDDTGTGFNGGAATLGHDGTNPVTGLNTNLKVFTHNKVANISGVGATGTAGQIDDDEIFVNLATPAVTDVAGTWTAWIDQQILKGATFLDLSGRQFASQAQLDAFFEGLRDAADRVNITRIDIGFDDTGTGFNGGAATLGHDGTNPVTGLNTNLKVFTHNKVANISGVGATGTAGQIDDDEIFVNLATPAVTDVAGTWTAWINQQVLQGSTHLDLSSAQFSSQAELDNFFSGLENATGKANITRIDIGFDDTGTGFNGGAAVLGNGATALNNDLKVYTHNKAANISGVGATGTAGEIDTDEVFLALATPTIAANAGTWTAWINQQLLKGSKHLDLRALEFESQDEVNAFFAGLNAATDKVSIARIDLKIAAAYATDALVVGMMGSSTRTAGLNGALKIYVDTSLKNTVVITGAGGAEANEITDLNLHADSSDLGFDKTNAVEWHSYILHHLGQGKATLDLKDVTIANDVQATALQTALSSLPSKLKSQLRGILVRLQGGDLANDSFTGNEFKLDFTALGLSNLEYLFIDLNETQDGAANVSANITGLAGDKVISLNAHA